MGYTIPKNRTELKASNKALMNLHTREMLKSPVFVLNKDAVVKIDISDITPKQEMPLMDEVVEYELDDSSPSEIDIDPEISGGDLHHLATYKDDVRIKMSKNSSTEVSSQIVSRFGTLYDRVYKKLEQWHAPIKAMSKRRDVKRAVYLANKATPILHEISTVMDRIIGEDRLNANPRLKYVYDRINSIRLFMSSTLGLYHMYGEYIGTVEDFRVKERAVREMFYIKNMNVSGDECINGTQCAYDMFINSKMFLAHIATKYTIVAVMTEMKVEEENRVQDFIADAMTGQVFGTTHIVIELPLDNGTVVRVGICTRAMDKTLNLKWDNSASQTDVIEQLQADMLSSLKGKYLTVGEHRWDSDLIAINTFEPDIPKFFIKDIANRISSICVKAFETKQKITILLYGKPGTGKTCALRAALKDMDCIIANIEESPTEGMIKLLTGVKSINRIVVMEEVDSGDIDATEKSEKVRSILTFLDSSSFDVAIMTVNSVDIYSAILRSGRCDIKIKFDMPDCDHRVEIISSVYKEFFKGDIDQSLLLKLASMTNGFSPADLTSWIKQVYLNSVDNSGVDIEKELISFKKSLEELAEYKKEERESKD
jgi:hypothetical protein